MMLNVVLLLRTEGENEKNRMYPQQTLHFQLLIILPVGQEGQFSHPGIRERN